MLPVRGATSIDARRAQAPAVASHYARGACTRGAMSRVVVVHGVGRQLDTAETLSAEVEPALRGGVGLALRRDPSLGRLADGDIVCAGYGDLYRKSGARGEPYYRAEDVQPGFEAELLETWWREAARLDPAIPCPPAPGSSVPSPAGCWSRTSSRCTATSPSPNSGRQHHRCGTAGSSVATVAASTIVCPGPAHPAHSPPRCCRAGLRPPAARTAADGTGVWPAPVSGGPTWPTAATWSPSRELAPRSGRRSWTCGWTTAPDPCASSTSRTRSPGVPATRPRAGGTPPSRRSLAARRRPTSRRRLPGRRDRHRRAHSAGADDDHFPTHR